MQRQNVAGRIVADRDNLIEVYAAEPPAVANSALAAGLLDVSGTALLLVAVRTGLTAIVAPVASLTPAYTVMLAGLAVTVSTAGLTVKVSCTGGAASQFELPA